MPPLITKPLIIEIEMQIAAHELEIKILTQARQILQNGCKHEFNPEGSDHNYKYEKCSICGLTQKQ